MTSPAIDRSEIRRMKLRERESLPAQSRRVASEQIADFVWRIFGDHVQTVHAYLNHKSEVETRSLIGRLVATGRRVLVPVVNPAEEGKHILEHWELDNVEDVVSGQYAIDKPRSKALADPSTVNSILVPLAAFDRHGTRLGYGKGYYDRFLNEFPKPVRIGLAFECQEVDHIPREQYDEPLDIIVTEKEVITTGARTLPVE